MPIDYNDTGIVTGAIANITDGADAVPIKSWGVTVDANLSGVSAVECTQTGKNLLNYADITTSYHVTSLTDNGGGSFTVVANGLGAYIDHVIKVKAGQAYSIKCTSATNDEGNASQIGVVNVYDGSDDTATLLLNGASISTRKGFTPTGNYILVRNKVTGGSGSGTGTIVEPQLELGSTATAYEAYTAPTVTTVNLGRTIYGGTADVVKGTGTDTHAKMTFTGADAENWQFSASGSNYRVFVQLTNAKTDTNTFVSNLITPAPSASGYPSIGQGWINNNGRIVIGVDSSITSASDWKTYLSNNNMEIAYELADEYKTDFTFTPISPTPETALGVNNFWADEGDSELTYYKDGYGYTSVTVHKETPEGEPVEETRKFHRIIYEGQVDVISGTGLIYIGESGTEYDPPEEISFEPIGIATDEGENTFYADEGVSVITYRREVE